MGSIVDSHIINVKLMISNWCYKADVLKLVAKLDLDPSAEMCESSSLSVRIIINLTIVFHVDMLVITSRYSLSGKISAFQAEAIGSSPFTCSYPIN